MAHEKWLDGTPIVKARHILTISDDENDGEDNEAYRIYDFLSHNELTPKEVIDDYIEKYGSEGDGVEDETIARDTWYWGVSGNYFLTQDQHTGNFDIWEGSCLPYHKNNLQQTIMTQEEYDNKREELVESFVMDLDDEDVIALHNAYCEVNNDPDSTIFPNDEYTFNELMGNKDPYDLAMDLGGDDYNTRHDYFTVGVYGPASFDSPYDDKSPVCLSDILNRGVEDVIELLDDANIKHDDLDDDLESLETEYQETVVKAQFKADWEKLSSEVSPMFEFANGVYCYVQYDENWETLTSGSVCNAGFCMDDESVEIQVDYDLTVQDNLNNLYDKIIDKHPEYDE